MEDYSLDEIARAIWIAGGNRADLWDDEHNDGWRPYMCNAKEEFRERAVRFLAALPEAGNMGRPD